MNIWEKTALAFKMLGKPVPEQGEQRIDELLDKIGN